LCLGGHTSTWSRWSTPSSCSPCPPPGQASTSTQYRDNPGHRADTRLLLGPVRFPECRAPVCLFGSVSRLKGSTWACAWMASCSAAAACTTRGTTWWRQRRARPPRQPPRSPRRTPRLPNTPPSPLPRRPCPYSHPPHQPHSSDRLVPQDLQDPPLKGLDGLKAPQTEWQHKAPKPE